MISWEGNGTPLQYSCLENPMDGGAWWAAVHGVAKSQTWLSDFTFTFHFPALEKEMATHSSVLAWRIPGMGEPGGLLSMGSDRVGHDWSDSASAVDIKHFFNVTVGHLNNFFGETSIQILSPFLKIDCWFLLSYMNSLGFPGGLVVKNPPINAGGLGLIPGLGRSPGEGNGYWLQYSCLENPMDRGAWQATVHGVTKSTATVHGIGHDLVNNNNKTIWIIFIIWIFILYWIWFINMFFHFINCHFILLMVFIAIQKFLVNFLVNL